MDTAGAESKVQTVLLGLQNQSKPFTSLSGGWRTRCDLACALTQQMDILLLDEPTNFLDLPAVIWLQHYITTNLSKTTVVVVTHDHDFADAVGDELILLRTVPAKTLETFRGNFSTYVKIQSPPTFGPPNALVTTKSLNRPLRARRSLKNEPAWKSDSKEAVSS